MELYRVARISHTLGLTTPLSSAIMAIILCESIFQDVVVTYTAPDGSIAHGQVWRGKYGERAPTVTGTIKKVSWWHQSIVDWELANPHRSMGDCAEFFDVTPAWLSTVRNSDAFRAYAARRRNEHNDNVSQGVIGKVEKLAELSMEVLSERIVAERRTIGLEGLKDTAEMALKALGFGQAKGNAAGATTNVQVNVVDAQALAIARERMRSIGAPSSEGELQNGRVTEVLPAST